MRMFLCCGFERFVDVEGDDGAEGLGVVDVAQAPDGFEFFLGEGARFFDVEIGGERFNAGVGLFAGDFGRRWCGWEGRCCVGWSGRGWWERFGGGEGDRGFLFKKVDFIFVGFF